MELYDGSMKALKNGRLHTPTRSCLGHPMKESSCATGISARRFRSYAQRMGGDLLSRGLAPRVPSALAGLTSLFGMGRGVPPPL